MRKKKGRCEEVLKECVDSRGEGREYVPDECAGDRQVKQKLKVRDGIDRCNDKVTRPGVNEGRQV